MIDILSCDNEVTVVSDAKKHTILIVDDAWENILVLKTILTPEFIVKIATNGELALKIAEMQSPDLILLDVVMPDMDGYEVCIKLKANSVTRHIPVLFVTSLIESKDEQRGFSVGAADYINKPFQREVVNARVRCQLEVKMYRDNLQILIDERTQELSRSQDATIFTVANLAEIRDPETGAHIMRTQHYVKALALYLSTSVKHSNLLTSQNIESIFKSAPLHDIGKVGIPDHILLKPGKLTTEEFEEMKTHTIKGWETLNMTEQRFGPNTLLRYSGEITYCHHEKWDGSGYPRGLSGQDIPLSARLMAVADVYDALISRRPYKEPWPHDKVVAVIIEGSGKHFDPDVVDAFVALEKEFQDICTKIKDFS